MHATEDAAGLFHAVPDDAAAAMGANRCQLLDGAFEGIECPCPIAHPDFEGVRIIVSALVAYGHDMLLSATATRIDNIHLLAEFLASACLRDKIGPPHEQSGRSRVRLHSPPTSGVTP